MCIRPKSLHGRLFKCGKCIECIMSRTDDWSLRFLVESRHNKRCLFVRLSYGPSFLPRNEELEKEFNVCGVLKYSDVQGFLKRLRYYINEDLRFFCAGEYGDEGRRAHYHIVLFFNKTTYNDMFSYIRKCWPFGFVKIDLMKDFSNFRYLTYYLGKQHYYSMPKDIRPFNKMSLRPAIGKYDIDEFLDFDSGFPFFRNGKKLSLIPLFYLKNLGWDPETYYNDYENFRKFQNLPVSAPSEDTLRLRRYQEQIYNKRLTKH